LLEQGAESSAECFADIPASVLSRLNLTPEKSLCNARGTESCHGSQCGMMLQPLTETHGEDTLLSFAEVSHAKTSAQQEKAQGSQESEADCGRSLQESLAKYDPVTCSWKTPQCSLFGDLELFSGTWPRWGMMRTGVCWELSMPAHLTRGIESGYLHTPTSNEDSYRLNGNSQQSKSLGALARKEAIGQPMRPTPRVGGQECYETRAKRKGHEMAMSYLESAVDYREHFFPTPGTTGMSNGSGNCEKSNKLHEMGLITDEERRSMRSGNGGQLNPTWVEWLMGWPLGWTDLKPLETDKFQQWLNSHGIL